MSGLSRLELQKARCEKFTPRFEKTIDTPGGDDCAYYIEDGETAGYCRKEELYRCVRDVGVKHIPLSASSINTFVTCHRMYYLTAVRGIRAKQAQMSNALKMGKLWDTAKQKLYGADVDMNAVVDEYEIGNREIAKVRALYRAFKMLELKTPEGYETQAAFNHVFDVYESDSGMNKVYVKGFYDRKGDKHFVEDKMSSRPDNYLDIFLLSTQIGTYFIADPSMEYCIMEIARTPDLKSTGKFKEESDEEYGERCYQDILTRPSFYFIGLDRTKGTYGKKFYRSEFDLDEVLGMYRQVSIEIHDACGFDGFYKNNRVCNNILPGIGCEYKGICQNNVISELVYEIRKDKGEKL